MRQNIKYIARACRWFDKVNGNTYHSVNVTRTEDGAVIYCPFEYGYGDQYRTTALLAMKVAGWLPKKYCTPSSIGGYAFYSYERENQYPIYWDVTDGLKRDCVNNGTDPALKASKS
jgi:hypothetical protein